ncbi:MAG: hypothetical protein WHS44_00170 [Fimbriimonadales bacterium]|nr:MAG: hypothetical protein KatS3mg018_0913 [Fimbriimonadales bacterium]
MPNLLIVWRFPNATMPSPVPVSRMLHHWGYTTEVAYYQSETQLITRGAGTIAPDGTAARNYIRQFDAVLVFNVERFGSASASPGDAAAAWLGWNTDDDPPVLFFGMNLHASRTALNTRLPSDFPIIRWNPSDANTFYEAETAASTSPHVLSSFWGVPCRGGTTVRLTRENLRLHTSSFVGYEISGTNQLYFARLNPSAHASLQSTNITYRGRTMPKGELLAYPDYSESAHSGGRAFGTDAVAAYRYAQHYLLPNSLANTRSWVDIQSLYSFWLPYGLKLAGVLPSRPFPVYFETDHFMTIRPVGYDATTLLTSYRAFWEWLADFTYSRGTHIICGTYGSNTTLGVRSHPIDSEVDATLNPAQRAIGEQVLQILRANHHRGLPVGIHDHAVFAGAGWGDNAIGTGTIYRHTATERWTRGKPNDVRRRAGRLVRKDAYTGTPPAGTLEVDIDGQTYYDIPTGAPEEMTGAGDLASPHRHRDYHLAKIVIERGEEYVVNQLGFPDAWCGQHRYTNTAGNSSGGMGYCLALKEKGVRGIRHEDSPTVGAFQQRVPISRMWNGVILPLARAIESSGAPTGGLYHPSKSNWVAFGGTNNFNINSDISTNWDTQYAAMAWRAYQRIMTTALTGWLGASIRLEAPYCHPPNIVAMLSPTNPNADFDPAIQSYIGIADGVPSPHFNYLRELMLQMDAVIGILPEFYRWGTVTDVMDRIEAGV